MDIKILNFSTGAAQARGVAVIIDVFRAFSFESYAFSKGAESIYPVADVTVARTLKAHNPELLLAGERGGKKLSGFDFGNSPFEISDKNLAGKSIIHTTSAGTQGIDAAEKADVILLAAFVNARATAAYIRALAPETLSLVCMGFENREEADEDTLCAIYIKTLLEGGCFDKQAAYRKLKEGSGARFMDTRNASFSPPEDFELCMRYDLFDFALRVGLDATGRKYVFSQKMQEEI